MHPSASSLYCLSLLTTRPNGHLYERDLHNDLSGFGGGFDDFFGLSGLREMDGKPTRPLSRRHGNHVPFHDLEFMTDALLTDTLSPLLGDYLLLLLVLFFLALCFAFGGFRVRNWSGCFLMLLDVDKLGLDPTAHVYKVDGHYAG